jgi:hypothetical protein
MKKILTDDDKNYRPQLGYQLKLYALEAMKKTNTGNLSPNWTQTDMARFFQAKGIQSVLGGELPANIKRMLKRFDKDFDL